jgi:hypothetical protein
MHIQYDMNKQFKKRREVYAIKKSIKARQNMQSCEEEKERFKEPLFFLKEISDTEGVGGGSSDDSWSRSM